MTKLLGTGGYAQTGKDAIIDILVEEGGWAKTYMSKPLEQALLKLNPWVNINWDNWKDDSWQKVVHHFRYTSWSFVPWMRYQELHALIGYEASKNNHDVRDYLQKLGTEVGRDMFDKNVWVNIGFGEVDTALAAGTSIGITGIRYHNELDNIHHRGGLTVWVNRPGYGPVNGHSSDNTLGPDDFDVVIENAGTLDDLRNSILYVVSMYNSYQRLDEAA